MYLKKKKKPEHPTDISSVIMTEVTHLLNVCQAQKYVEENPHFAQSAWVIFTIVELRTELEFQHKAPNSFSVQGVALWKHSWRLSRKCSSPGTHSQNCLPLFLMSYIYITGIKTVTKGHYRKQNRAR